MKNIELSSSEKMLVGGGMISCFDYTLLTIICGGIAAVTISSSYLYDKFVDINISKEGVQFNIKEGSPDIAIGEYNINVFTGILLPSLVSMVVVMSLFGSNK